MGDLAPDPAFLTELAQARMPFGKYRGRWLTDLPEAYYAWFQRKGWPTGRLGEQLAAMHEIKINGLEYLVREVRKLQADGTSS